jgi:hypothetical protein
MHPTLARLRVLTLAILAAGLIVPLDGWPHRLLGA